MKSAQKLKDMRKRINRGLLSGAIGMVAVLLLSLLPGCNTSGCTENRSSILLAGFYSSTTAEPITVDSLEIGGVGAPGDSLLVKVGDSTSELYLPFRTIQSSTAFYIHYASTALNYDEINDTIAFDYESIPYFASEECGAMYRYKIKRLSCTYHLVDSIELLDSMITNFDIQRLKIYFRTASRN